MRRLLRWALRIPPPRISRDYALSVAREEFEARGWRNGRWGVPMPENLHERLRHYIVIAPIGARAVGSFVIDNQNGEVSKVQVVSLNGESGPEDLFGEGGAGVPAKPTPPSRPAAMAERLPTGEMRR